MKETLHQSTERIGSKVLPEESHQNSVENNSTLGHSEDAHTVGISACTKTDERVTESTENLTDDDKTRSVGGSEWEEVTNEVCETTNDISSQLNSDTELEVNIIENTNFKLI